MHSLISIEKVGVQYPKSEPIFQDVSFEIQKGEALGLIGANGCGKSSLISVIAGLIPHYEGNITFKGEALQREHLNYVGFVFDHTAFPPLMNSRDILFFFQDLYQKKSQKYSPDTLLKFCGLSEPKKAFHKLSKGTRQRLALAVALLKEPELLIVDEGFNSIDPEHKQKIFEYLHQEVVAQNLTLLVATHQEEDCEVLATRTLRFEELKGEPCHV